MRNFQRADKTVPADAAISYETMLWQKEQCVPLCLEGQEGRGEKVGREERGESKEKEM